MDVTMQDGMATPPHNSPKSSFLPAPGLAPSGSADEKGAGEEKKVEIEIVPISAVDLDSYIANYSGLPLPHTSPVPSFSHSLWISGGVVSCISQWMLTLTLFLLFFCRPNQDHPPRVHWRLLPPTPRGCLQALFEGTAEHLEHGKVPGPWQEAQRAPHRIWAARFSV